MFDPIFSDYPIDPRYAPTASSSVTAPPASMGGRFSKLDDQQTVGLFLLILWVGLSWSG